MLRLKVLTAGGYRVHAAMPAGEDQRPLCCGRTFLAVGQVEEARAEMQRTLDVLAPFAARGIPVIGLEPSCLFTFRDELPALIKSDAAAAVAGQAMLLEEFLAREQAQGQLKLPLGPLPRKALLHGHCHQKAFDAMGAVESVLKLIPQLTVENRRVELLRHGRIVLATTPTPSRFRSRWANCRCCRRCARRTPTR